jgi:Flp pilus assembly protein TadD
LARNNLGSLLLHSGRLDDAIVELKEALKMAPDNPSAHNNLAGALAIRDGLTREVVNHYQEALRIDPNHLNAHRNLGVYLFQNDRPREASVHFERMLEIQPTNVVARIHLARILAAQGQAEGAIAHYEKILEMDPANVVALGGLSDLLVGKGRWSEAVGRLRTALEVQPDNAGLCNNLAWILASCPVASVRDGPRAVELGLTAERLSGGTNSVIVGTLAAAYAEAGRFSEATTTARRAMALAANPTQVNTLQSHISLYEAGRPFHQSDATNAIVQPVER